MNNSEEISAVIQMYYALKEELSNINKKLADLMLIKDNLKDLKNAKSNEIYVNLGGLIFAKATIEDISTLLVNVGNNIFVNKSIDDVIKIVEKQIQDLESYKRDLESQLNDIKVQLEDIGKKLDSTSPTK